LSDWIGVNTKVFFGIFGFDLGSKEFGVQKSFGIGVSQEIGGFIVSVSDFRIVDRKALAFWLRRHFIKDFNAWDFASFPINSTSIVLFML
jgi:hypothetical protein